jgi:hypothetical protein
MRRSEGGLASHPRVTEPSSDLERRGHSVRSAVRIEQSTQELDRLTGEFHSWLAVRIHADKHCQYHTQLLSLQTVIERAVERVRAELYAPPQRSSLGEVYERCRTIDCRALIVRRLWLFFRDKWDQRDDRVLGPVVAAADEIVWSCWAGPSRELGRGSAPAPLPYIEPQFSAHASPRLLPPQQIRTADELLGTLLAKLPIPLTGLPPVCIERPWWLVVLAHETGHHIAYDLLDEPTYQRVRAVVRAAAGAHAGDKSSSPIRVGWTHELFADAFAVACVGDAHLWAIEELELAGEERMVADAGSYPPALARGSFNRAALAALADHEEEAAPPSARLRELVEAIRPLARALIDTPLDVDERRSLRLLCDWRSERFARGGAVATWKDELLSEHELVPETTLTAARLAAAGSVAAWRSVAVESDAESRDLRRDRLRQRTLDLVANCREEGTRSATDTTSVDRVYRDVTVLADELANVLVDATVES